MSIDLTENCLGWWTFDEAVLDESVYRFPDSISGNFISVQTYELDYADARDFIVESGKLGSCVKVTDGINAGTTIDVRLRTIDNDADMRSLFDLTNSRSFAFFMKHNHSDNDSEDIGEQKLLTWSWWGMADPPPIFESVWEFRTSNVVEGVAVSFNVFPTGLANAGTTGLSTFKSLLDADYSGVEDMEDEWIFVCGVWDTSKTGGARCILYTGVCSAGTLVSGTSEGTDSDSAVQTMETIAANGTGLTHEGLFSSPSFGFPGGDFPKYAGLLDHLMVFDKALTEEEVNFLYNGGAGVTSLLETSDIINRFGVVRGRFGATNRVSTTSRFGATNILEDNKF